MTDQPAATARRSRGRRPRADPRAPREASAAARLRTAALPGAGAGHAHHRGGARGPPRPRAGHRDGRDACRSPVASSSSATPASSASRRCARAAAPRSRRCSRSTSVGEAAARRLEGPTSTSATTSRSPARSSRRVAASCSVLVDAWQIAAKTLRPLPVEHKPLAEETRVRQRYVDLIVRPQAREVARLRVAVVASLRESFAAARLPRGRDADAADDARRRQRPAVRHALERLRHGAVPAHRARAVPQALHRRRARAGVRDQPQLPQRGRRLHPLARVRDARVLRGVRRLPRHGARSRAS